MQLCHLCLLQCYVVLWIHVIDAMCIMEPFFLLQVDGLLSLVQLVYLTVADFRIGACVPQNCTVQDMYINYNYLYNSINVTGAPQVAELVTEENKRHEMDDYAISMM